MDEEELTELIRSKIRQWKQSQEGITDGYDYEASLVKMVDEIGKEIFQESIGPLPKDRKRKKNSSPSSEKSPYPKNIL